MRRKISPTAIRRLKDKLRELEDSVSDYAKCYYFTAMFFMSLTNAIDEAYTNNSLPKHLESAKINKQ